MINFFKQLLIIITITITITITVTVSHLHLAITTNSPLFILLSYKLFVLNTCSDKCTAASGTHLHASLQLNLVTWSAWSGLESTAAIGTRRHVLMQLKEVT